MLRSTAACFGIVFLCACAKDRPATADLAITSIDTLIAAGNTDLGHPVELTMADNRLYVLDASSPAIVVIDTTGAILRRIGRGGSGPGELRTPHSVFVSGDTLRVVEAGNGRVQLFTTQGQAIRTVLAPNAVGADVSFRADGSGLIARNGVDSMLAQRLDAAGVPKAHLGLPVSPIQRTVDYRATKTAVMRGEVPPALRNLTIPVLAEDGSCWLLLHAEGTVERYSPSNTLIWRRTLTEPEFGVIRHQFFNDNQADSAARSLTILSYFATAHADGQELWILIRQPADAPTLILILNRDGFVKRRIRVPGARGIRRFARDSVGQSVYLLAYDDAAILRVHLSQVP